MKITDVKLRFAKHYLFVQVYTDAGIVGLGEAGNWGYLQATAAAIAMRWSLWLLTVPPQRDGAGQWAAGPEGTVRSLFLSMTSPSFVCLISVPRMVKKSQTVASRSDSLMRSLCASVIVDVPLAPVIATAMTGTRSGNCAALTVSPWSGTPFPAM